MKTPFALVLAAAVLLAPGTTLHSQAPAAAPSPQQILQAMKLKNQELLARQAATLQKLDDLEKEAEQLKIFAKRS